jgi:hypothetical protein
MSLLSSENILKHRSRLVHENYQFITGNCQLKPTKRTNDTYIFSICSTYMFRSCLTITSVRYYIRVSVVVKHDRNMQVLQIQKIYIICVFCSFSLAIILQCTV